MSNNIAVSWVDSSAPVESYEEAIKPNTKVMLAHTYFLPYTGNIWQRKIFGEPYWRGKNYGKWLTIRQIRQVFPSKIFPCTISCSILVAVWIYMTVTCNV